MQTLKRTAALLAGLLLAGASLAACSSDDSGSTSSPTTTSATAGATGKTDQEVVPVIDPGDGGNYDPQLDPADFVDVVDNPYLPMPVGARWHYEGEAEGEPESIDIVVTDQRKEIIGISAIVVRDTVMVAGEVVEDTYDWFAQDVEGNVWYLGEDVKDYENGQVVSTAGSWEAGVDGALPGIVMPAVPATGDAYRQEFFAGEAEDMMEITETGGSLTVPAGTFDDVVTTKDWTPLEPDVIEVKSYARGVGKVREEKVAGGDGFAELVEFSLGS